MNDQDQINEEERQEAATETPASLGCPQHMPTHLPCGFDGAEPAQKKRSDLEKMNNLLRNRLRKISDIADKAVMGIRTDEEHNIALLGACTEIRNLVDFYKPREKPVDPTEPEVVHPQRLDDIGMQMSKTVIVDDDGVICKIRRAGVLMMGIGRPAQLWEIDAMKHPTYCRVQVFCDHKPIFDGKAFGKNVHRADALGLAVVIRFVLAQRKHQRNCRAAKAAKKGGAK